MSGFSIYKPDYTRMRAAAGPPKTLAEQFSPRDFVAGVVPGGAAASSGVNFSDTQERYERAVMQDLLGAVQRAGVELPRKSVSVLGREIFSQPMTAASFLTPTHSSNLRPLLEAYARAREIDPSLPEYRSIDDILDEVTRRRHDDERAAQAQIPDSWAGAAGAFVGALGASFRDPAILATLPIGVGVVRATTLAASIARTALAEAGVQAGVAAAMTPYLFHDAARNEFAYDMGDAMADISLSAVLGGAFGGVAGGLNWAAEARAARAAEAAEAAEAVGNSSRDLANRLRRVAETRPLDGEEADALRVLEADAEISELNPYAPSPESEVAHRAQLEEATNALLEGRPNDLPVDPPLPPAPVVDAVPAGGAYQSGRYYEIPARDLKTDPQTFQYKSGGDAEGVTERLRGVTQWNADAAGTVLVWQREDGTLFVADGHQRSGLARRLMDEGHEADIRLTAKVYREADGFTAEEVMLRAAGANILNESGTAVDAARVIRIDGENSEYLAGMNWASAFGRDALGIARLADDAFTMVVNGDDATMRIGAIVGRVAADQPGLHAQMIATIRAAGLSNARQMELMARDMLAAPRVRESQTDMFGALDVQRSLFAERAQVLDRAIGMVTRARRALVSAADNVDVLEDAGSTVDRTTAQQVAQQNAMLAEAIQRMATRTDNVVSEALNNAARAVGEGARPDAAARDFIAELRARPNLIDDLYRGGEAGADAGGPAGPQRGAVADDQPADAAAGPDGERPGGDRAGPDARADAGSDGAGEQLDAFGITADDRNPVYPGTGKSIEEARAEAAALLQAHPARAAGEVPGTHNIDDGATLPDGSGRTRGDLRSEIAEQLLARPATKGHEAHIVLGPPAAGKSSLAEPLAAARGARIVDSDDAKALLPEFRDGIGATAIHEESAHIARAVERASIAQGDNIVLPVVGRTFDGLQNRLSELVEANYSIYIHFVDLPTDEAVRRAIRRYADTGRLVDPDYVASIGDAPARNFDRLLQEHGENIKGHLHVSNEVEQGSPPRLVRTSDEELYRPVGNRRQGASEGGQDHGPEPGPADARLDEENLRTTELGGAAPDGAAARVGGSPAGDQLDAFGITPADRRAALERQGEGRLRSGRQQRAPGEDGGLFDTQGRTADMFDSPQSAAADALSGRAIEDFDDPLGAGAAAQADHLLHDMRMEMNRPEAAGGLFDLADDGEPSLRDAVDDIDADEAAWTAMRHCLTDTGGTA